MDGYFASDSMLRRVQGERVLMNSGPRALLMQGARPLVVEGLPANADAHRHAMHAEYVKRAVLPLVPSRRRLAPC